MQHDHHMRHYWHNRIQEDDDTPEYWGELSKDVSSFRKLTRNGLSEVSRMTRRGYGAAVLSAINARHKAALKRELPEHKIECASGTIHNTGKSIIAAVRKQNAAKLFRQSPFDQAVANAKYEQAMKEKRNREAQARVMLSNDVDRLAA